MWSKYGIRVSKSGRICMDDLITKVDNNLVEDDKISKIVHQCDISVINGKSYVDEKMAICLIAYMKSDVANKLFVRYCNFDGYELCYPISGDIIGYNVLYFVINGQKWYRGIDLAYVLNYNNTRSAIRSHIKDGDKMSLFALDAYAFCHDFVLVKGSINGQTIFINENGLQQLILRSEKIVSVEIARAFGIDIHQKITRKEIDIVVELIDFCKSAGIEYTHPQTIQHRNKTYYIDFFLPEYEIAVEIDEFGHRDRDPQYEKARENCIKRVFKYTLIRSNPDDPEFTIAGLIGEIHKAIIEVGA